MVSRTLILNVVMGGGKNGRKTSSTSLYFDTKNVIQKFVVVITGTYSCKPPRNGFVDIGNEVVYFTLSVWSVN